MKRIFVDTNVFLEAILNRDYSNQAKQLFQDIDSGKLEAVTSVGSFYTITYYAELALKKKGIDQEKRMSVLRQILNSILNRVVIVYSDNSILMNGVNDNNFNDLEDSYQYHLAISAKCDSLVTLNTKDFPLSNDTLRIINLKDFT